MKREATPKERRLEALHRYQILNTEPEAAFKRLTSLTQRIFDAPVVLLSFLTDECQWVKAAEGFDGDYVELGESLCIQTIKRKGVNVILDYAENVASKQVANQALPSSIRFYAGAPLTTFDGQNIGTLCIIDHVPRARFTRDDETTLADLATMAMTELELRRTSEGLRTQADRNARIFDSISDAAYFLDLDWKFTYLNAQAEILLERSRSDLLGKEVWREFPKTEGSVLYHNYFHAQATGIAQIFEFHYPFLEKWFEVHAYPSDDGLSVYFQDITERRANEHSMRVQAEFRHNLLEFTQTFLQSELSEDFYQILLENAVKTIPGAQAGSLLLRQGNKHKYMAAVGFDLAALQSIEVDLSVEAQFIPNKFEPQLVKQWNIDYNSGKFQRVMEEQGRINEIQVSLCVPMAINGQHALALYLDNFDSPDAFDVTSIAMTRLFAQQAATLMQRLDLEKSLREERAELVRLAHFDHLTGLPNRTLFHERLQQAMRLVPKSKTFLAVLFLDLDNFKDINDSYGHGFGDFFITEVAERLRSLLREGDMIARWGGDEFVVMLPNLNKKADAVRLAKRLSTDLRRPFLIDGHTLHTSVSIGIAYHTEDEALDVLLQQADTALYEAKKTRNSVHVFDLAMAERWQNKIDLHSDLREAIESRAITLHYQPRIRLKDDRMTSVEALARWLHPTRGWIPPSTFIPLAEELGMIRQLGQLILDKACHQAKLWRQKDTPCRTAVNLSVEQLKYPRIVDEIRRTLLRNELEPDLLEIELTESTAMANIDEGVEKLKQLRDMGIHLAIDDFGTAYSSLAYLKRLPIQSLKIDRLFINDIGVGEGGRQSDVRVVGAIITLAKSLDLCVVAEGVETKEQRQVLEQLGCDEAQGYLFERPVSPENLEGWLMQCVNR